MVALIFGLTAAVVLLLCVVLTRRPGGDWEDFRPRTNEERYFAYCDRRATYDADRRRRKARQQVRVAQCLDMRAALRAHRNASTRPHEARHVQ